MIDADLALRHLERTQGVFLRSDVLELGVDDKVLRRLLAAGDVHRVRQGSYVFADTWSAADTDARHTMLTKAVLMRAGCRAVASHASAALLLDMPVHGVDLARAHVTRTDGAAGRTERDVVHHEGLCLGEDFAQVGGFRAVRPVRAALEVGLLGGVESGLVTADAGLRLGLFTPDDLARQHQSMSSWPAARPLQIVARMADGLSESVAESRTKYLLWRAGLPAPVQQLAVYDGTELIGYVDFAWPEHGLVAEFDGRVKYTTLLRPGETPADVVVREKLREDRIREVTGWRVVRLCWADLATPERTAARIRALLCAGTRRG